MLALVFLALLGKGPLSGKPGISDTGTTRGTTDSGSTSTGNNSNPSDNGVNTKNSPGDTSTTTGSGAPDKSKNMSPPGTMPGMPTFMMPVVTMMKNLGSNIANFISPTAPTGGTVLPGGNVFVPGLSLTGQSSGGPGAGPYTPSITTRYGNTTYTNFNPIALLNMFMPKGQGMSVPEMMKQPVPSMVPAIVPTLKKMIAPMVSIGKMVQNTPPNLVTIMTSIAPKMQTVSVPEMVKQPTPPMMMYAFENLQNAAYVKLLMQEMQLALPVMQQKMIVPPMGSSMVPNPLAPMQNNPFAGFASLGDYLTSLASGAAKNLMSNASGLQSLLGSNPLGIAIPPIGTPSLLPEITV